jgi:pimeloyl-ACP methyl ester carboxylesterase
MGQEPAMPHVVHGPDGTPIAWQATGAGEPILLIHGFASSARINWGSTGWIDFLVRGGRRVITFDCRGHGESGKPHDAAQYEETLMLGDALAVLDAAGAGTADVMGYSMGGYIALRLAHGAPERVRRLILGGVGGTYFTYWSERAEAIAQALLEPDPATLTDKTSRMFRSFAEKSGNDLVALAACMRRKRRIFSCEELDAFRQPTLVVCGETDDVSGPAGEIARCFPNARAVTVPKRDHMLTVGDRGYKDAVASFLNLTGSLA